MKTSSADGDGAAAAHTLAVARAAVPIRSALGPSPTRKQLADLLRTIAAPDGGGLDAVQLEATYQVLTESVPHPRFVSLVSMLDKGKTAEQVIDAAFAYKPVAP